jgi:hypothetical protein
VEGSSQGSTYPGHDSARAGRLPQKHRVKCGNVGFLWACRGHETPAINVCQHWQRVRFSDAASVCARRRVSCRAVGQRRFLRLRQLASHGLENSVVLRVADPAADYVFAHANLYQRLFGGAKAVVAELFSDLQICGMAKADPAPCGGREEGCGFHT